MAVGQPEVRSFPVHLLDLAAQYTAFELDLEGAVALVLRSGPYILAPEVEPLEDGATPHSGCVHGIAVSSGTDALFLCLAAEEIGPGDEVFVPDFSCFATAGVVSRAGASPVLVDIDAKTFHLDVNVEAAALP